MSHSHTSLEQWRAFQAVIDFGGFAQAATALHRSQSAISYSVNRLQEQLGVRLLEMDGRKARLTEMGRVLLDRSRHLVDSAQELEELADHLEQGWEAEIRLAVDAAFPMPLLFDSLKDFAQQAHGTRVTLTEVILSGAEDALIEKTADLVIGANLPAEYMSERLLDIEFIAVAHPEHPLNQLDNEMLTGKHLRSELQVIIRDSGHTHSQDVGWQNTEQRWLVSHIDTAIETIVHGMGFCWLPRHKIEDKLEAGILKALPLREGAVYSVPLHMAFVQQEYPGPATQLFAEKLKQVVTGL
jgi:DNA-binding transcriptional LysR family regulator